MLAIEMEIFLISREWAHWPPAGGEGGETIRQAASLPANNRHIRWGGEEFMIVSPSTTIEGAAGLAEKCRKAIEAHDFPEIGHKTSSFGVSLGR